LAGNLIWRIGRIWLQSPIIKSANINTFPVAPILWAARGYGTFPTLQEKGKARQNETRCSFLTEEKTHKADEVVSKVLEVSKQPLAQGKSRGKYNCYSDKQRAQIVPICS